MKKAKKLLAILMVAAMLLSITQPITSYAVASTGVFVDGSGTEEDPYLISNKYQLDNVRNKRKAHYKLTCDIEFEESDFAEGGEFYNNGAGFKPIGDSEEKAFAGIFDGNGYTIKNLYINIVSNSTKVYAGLFGYNVGTIENLGLVDGNISVATSSYYSDLYAGGIAGYSYGTITNCYNIGDVFATESGSAYVGGIAGYSYGTITNCYSIGDVSAASTSTAYNYYYSYAGGIAGDNSGTITNCYNTGDVTATSDKGGAYAGGIAGYSYNGTITNCYYLDIISVDIGYHYGTSTSDNVVKFTSDELNDQTTFVGFDFYDVWDFDIYGNVAYPVLRGVGIGNKFIEGTGTEQDPYLVSNKYQLGDAWLFTNAHYKLTCNIEFEESDFAESGYFYNDGAGFNPIGSSEDDAFTGTFDGNGYTIKNLYINIESDSGNGYAGLFGYNKGTIENLGMVDSNISISRDCNVYAGGIAGYSDYGTFTNCYSIGDVSATAMSSTYAGGIAGYSDYGTFTNCYSIGDVSVTAEEGGSGAGGIAGYSDYGTFTNCYSIGDVTVTTEDGGVKAGGIAGYSGYGTIENCYNIGDITATSDEGGGSAGGIAGDNNEGTITNCYNTGDITATSDEGGGSAGGIAGHCTNVTITNCYNTGDISATSGYNDADAGGIEGGSWGGTITNCYNTGGVSAISKMFSYAGGIAGDNNEGTITNCYNTGDIFAKLTWDTNSRIYAGGIAGNCWKGLITNCYNTGDISTTVIIAFDAYAYSIYAGGIAGYSHHVTIKNCYYSDIISDGVDYDYGGSANVVKCTSDELKDQTTFVGFDFENVWTFDDTLVLHEYPVLKDVAHIENIVYGDLDGDNELTAMDALMMKQYFVGMIGDSDITIAIADINKDGVLNSKDLLLLKQKLAE